MLATQAVAPELEEIYSSPMRPFYQQGQYHQLQQHDAQAIVLHNATPGRYAHYPFNDRPQLQYASSPSEEEMQRRANYVQRRAWMKRVAEWIAQTEMTGNYKPQRLDSIAEATEETHAPREQVLYIASPPSPSIPLYPFANPASTVYSSSASSSTSSVTSAKSLRRSSHGRTSSLESISEEVEE